MILFNFSKLYLFCLPIVLFTLLACSSSHYSKENISGMHAYSDDSINIKPIDYLNEWQAEYYINKAEEITFIIDDRIEDKKVLRRLLYELVLLLPVNMPYKDEYITLNTDHPNVSNGAKNINNEISRIVSNNDIQKKVITLIILMPWKNITPKIIDKIKQLNETKELFISIKIIGFGKEKNKKYTNRFKYNIEIYEAKILNNLSIMKSFVRKIFYYDKKDSDDDGIADIEDECKNTPKHQKVTWRGCLRNSMKSHPVYLIKNKQSLHSEVVY